MAAAYQMGADSSFSGCSRGKDGVDCCVTAAAWMGQAVHNYYSSGESGKAASVATVPWKGGSCSHSCFSLDRGVLLTRLLLLRWGWAVCGCPSEIFHSVLCFPVVL